VTHCSLALSRLYQYSIFFFFYLDFSPAAAIICLNRPPVPYDCSRSIWLDANTCPSAGASEQPFRSKTIDGFLSGSMRSSRRRLERKGSTRLAMAGAGAGGVELLLASEHRFGAMILRA